MMARYSVCLAPSGAGKTTTLEVIETLREKTSGEVTVDGLSIDHDADKIKQRIGVQLQAAGYYPNLNSFGAYFAFLRFIRDR